MIPAPKKILEMPAGSALDALVAEHFIGISPRKVRVRGTDLHVTVYSDNLALLDGVWSVEELKLHGRPLAYSTDVTKATDALSLWHGDVRLFRQNEQWKCELHQPSRSWEAWAFQLPLAICRALLLAKEGKVQGG